MKKNYIDPQTEIISVCTTHTLCASGDPVTPVVTFGTGAANGEAL